MMKYVRYAVLTILLIVALSACGTLVLWLFGKMLNITWDNLVGEGIKVGLIASVLLIAGNCYRNSKKSKETTE